MEISSGERARFGGEWTLIASVVFQHTFVTRSHSIY
jgi:hypothetical protein